MEHGCGFIKLKNDKTTSGREFGHADGVAAAGKKVSYSQGISPLFRHYRYCKFMLQFQTLFRKILSLFVPVLYWC